MSRAEQARRLKKDYPDMTPRDIADELEMRIGDVNAALGRGAPRNARAIAAEREQERKAS